MFYFTAPLSGPHINAISEEKGSVLISWDEIPAREQMGCILHYRIYWKERDSNSQPQLCGMCERQRQQGLSCLGVGKTQAVQVLALYLGLSRCSINMCKVNWMKKSKRHLNTHTHSYWICVTCQAMEEIKLMNEALKELTYMGTAFQKAIKALGYHYIDPWGLWGMRLENLWIPTLANTIIACYFLLKWIKYNLSNSLWPIIMQ